MLGYYNYTVILTYIGSLVSFLGVVLAINGNVFKALLCLLVAGFCDMFDGRIAATKERTKSEKHFGIQIDSLSDIIAFGVLPAVIVLLLQPTSIPGGCACGFYMLCALIRLAYFNVDEAARQELTEGSREYYKGLPVTSAALIVPIVFCVALIPRFPVHIVAPAVLFLMGIAFLSPFTLKKPRMTGKIVLLIIGLVELVFLIVKGMR